MTRRQRKLGILLLVTWVTTGALYTLLQVKGQGGKDKIFPLQESNTDHPEVNRRLKREEPGGNDAFPSGRKLPDGNDVMPSVRKLPDPRHPRCSEYYKPWSWSEDQVSVVIAFHNEQQDHLFRTIESVLGRSPDRLLKEIILVDDFSTNQSAGSSLSKWPKVRLQRNQRREGLIRSRDAGARSATGQYLFFLDSHCEVNVGWIQPLVQVIKEFPLSLVSPVIDVIEAETLQYRPSSSHLKGAFDWSLRFEWLPLGQDEKSIKHPQKPFRTPVTPGGLFMVRKDWYIQLGGFDPGLQIWGTENLEMSVKAWLCGGQVLTSPCSRVGHVFRRHHPYSFPMGPQDTYTRNSRRLVDVWFDKYKTFFYQNHPSLSPRTNPGNLTERLALKARLRCKPFEWFLDNVYPQLRLPSVKEVSAAGQLKQGDTCLDSDKSRISLTSCLMDSHTQSWSLTAEGELMTSVGNRCLVVTAQNTLALQPCSNTSPNTKRWLRRGRSLRHSKLCLSTLDSADRKSILALSPCNSASYGQMWDFTTELQTML